MLKRLLSFALCVMALVMVTMTAASADTGPKPSVVVTFKGVEQKNCYVTLLSKTSSTGPHRAYKSDYTRYIENSRDIEIWEKFVSYEDADGFYFLQFFSKLGEDLTFRWTYCPPSEATNTARKQRLL